MTHEHAAHVAQGINWWAWDAHRSPMGWFLLDFAVFVLLLVYFTAKPLRAALTERHHTIRRAVTQAAASHAKAISEQQLWAQKLAGLDGDLRQLNTESRNDGEAEVAQMITDAQQRADELRRDAAVQTQQELLRAHETLRQQSLAEVLKLTEKMVTQAITTGDQRQLITAATTSLPALPHRARESRQPLGGHV